jgi:VanZ family protein
MLPAFAWFALTVVLLSLPGDSFPDIQIWSRDKLAHAGLFGIQAFLLWLALELPRPLVLPHRRALFVAGLATALWGGASEVYQLLCTSRSASVWDALANCVGVTLVLLVLTALGLPRILQRFTGSPH